MAFLHCEIASESLRMATAVDVILPDKGELSEVKTLYLLHGLTDDCTGWTRYTAVESCRNLSAWQHRCLLPCRIPGIWPPRQWCTCCMA